jgi:DNA-binding SARP family transcriptional activator
MRSFGRVSDDAMALCELANAAIQAGVHSLGVDLATEARAFAEADGSPRSLARALLVRARAGPACARRDDDVAEALALTEDHGFTALWTRRDRSAAAAVLPRAISAGLGPPDAAARLAWDCGGDVLAACAPALGTPGVGRRRAGRGAPAPRPPLNVRTFGGLQAAIGDRPIADRDFGRAKARALLGALVVAGGAVHRDVLLEWLWPALAPRRGAAALRTTLHALRRALEPGVRAREERSVVLNEGDLYGLAPKPGDHIDLHEFLEIVRAPTTPEGPAERLATLERAEALYRGPLLPEWPYEEWTLAPRDEAETAFRHLLHRLALALLDAGRPRAAIAQLRRLIALDPLSEESHRTLMRAYAAAGERGLALRQFHACRAALRREQGVEPAAATRELYGSLLIGELGGPSVTRA